MTGQPPVEDPQSERHPFWSYTDLFILIGMGIVSLFVGAWLVKAVFLIFRIHTSLKVLELLPAQAAGYVLLFGAMALLFRVEYDRPFWRSLSWADVPPRRLPWLISVGFGTALAVS